MTLIATHGGVSPLSPSVVVSQSSSEHSLHLGRGREGGREGSEQYFVIIFNYTLSHSLLLPMMYCKWIKLQITPWHLHRIEDDHSRCKIVKIWETALGLQTPRRGRLWISSDHSEGKYEGTFQTLFTPGDITAHAWTWDTNDDNYLASRAAPVSWVCGKFTT